MLSLREGMPDLGAVESATRTVAAALAAGDLVVLESTTAARPGPRHVVPAVVLYECAVRRQDRRGDEEEPSARPLQRRPQSLQVLEAIDKKEAL